MTKRAAPAEEFPALRAFMHGYLHEDYVEEYGSARNAVREFRADADEEEFSAVAVQWRRFFDGAKSKPIETVQTVIRELGGGWRPASHAEIQALTKLFREPHAKEESEE